MERFAVQRLPECSLGSWKQVFWSSMRTRNLMSRCSSFCRSPVKPFVSERAAPSFQPVQSTGPAFLSLDALDITPEDSWRTGHGPVDGMQPSCLGVVDEQATGRACQISIQPMSPFCPRSVLLLGHGSHSMFPGAHLLAPWSLVAAAVGSPQSIPVGGNMMC